VLSLLLSLRDSAGAVDGLNLYVYVDNNPLKYIDPTGHGDVGADVQDATLLFCLVG
jgi:hypothetical protein